MDFSWVKQLADQSNQTEMARQEKIRREREEKKLAALATVPFVEKLFVVINGATEEFNKHCVFPNLRLQISRPYKHSRTEEESTAEPDEVAYFAFTRCGYLYGIRGMNGIVEFISIPVGDSSALAMKLHELGVSPLEKLEAQIESDTKKVRWMHRGAPIDGPSIIALCQKFFVDLIEKTNNIVEDERPTYHNSH